MTLEILLRKQSLITHCSPKEAINIKDSSRTHRGAKAESTWPQASRLRLGSHCCCKHLGECISRWKISGSPFFLPLKYTKRNKYVGESTFPGNQRELGSGRALVVVVKLYVVWDPCMSHQSVWAAGTNAHFGRPRVLESLPPTWET